MYRTLMFNMSMKRIICFALILAVLFSFSGCYGDVSKVKVDLGNSDKYSSEDLSLAVEVIKDKFKEFDGCILYELKYRGDGDFEENLEYCQTLEEDNSLTECVVFDSVFHSPKNGGDAWEPDTDYTWDWYLARKNKSDKWILVTFGY